MSVGRDEIDDENERELDEEEEMKEGTDEDADEEGTTGGIANGFVGTDTRRWLELDLGLGMEDMRKCAADGDLAESNPDSRIAPQKSRGKKLKFNLLK